MDIAGFVTGTVVALLSLGFAYFTFQWKDRKNLSVILKTTPIISISASTGRAGVEESKLQLLYGGVDIRQLVMTDVALFNDGRQSIQGAQDIQRPIVIRVVNGVRLIDCEVKMYPPENRGEIHPRRIVLINAEEDLLPMEQDHSGQQLGVQIGIGYLNRGQGCVVRLLHDGAKESPIKKPIPGGGAGINGLTERNIRGQSTEWWAAAGMAVGVTAGAALNFGLKYFVTDQGFIHGPAGIGVGIGLFASVAFGVPKLIDFRPIAREYAEKLWTADYGPLTAANTGTGTRTVTGTGGGLTTHG